MTRLVKAALLVAFTAIVSVPIVKFKDTSFMMGALWGIALLEWALAFILLRKRESDKTTANQAAVVKRLVAAASDHPDIETPTQHRPFYGLLRSGGTPQGRSS